jgi:hypothetical protein
LHLSSFCTVNIFVIYFAYFFRVVSGSKKSGVGQDGRNRKPHKSVRENGTNMTPLKSVRKIFVGGLSYATTEETLRTYFAQFGELIDSVVMTFPENKDREASTSSSTPQTSRWMPARQGWKKPGFFFKPSPVGFFVFLFFWGVLWVFGVFLVFYIYLPRR